jgi:FSR family fosmidomycin resistance protein-like MFS transporter
MLFIFFVSSAAGVLLGGIVGDRIGRYSIIWISILGPLPLTLLLPHVDFLDRRSYGPDQSDHGECFHLHHDLCLGACATSDRLGRWNILWTQLWNGGIAAAILGGMADRIGIEKVYQLLRIFASGRAFNSIPAKDNG